MKAMILAAGRGERMRPLTEHTPKPLLLVAGKPLIVYHLERLAQCGIQDVVINIAYLGEQIREALGNGASWGLHIEYSQEPEPLETAGALHYALPLLDDDPFLLINGDVWTDFPLSELVDKPLAQQSLGRLVLVDNPDHNPQGDFGLEHSMLQGKSSSIAAYTFSGMGLFSPDIIHRYPQKRRIFPMREVFAYGIEEQLLEAVVYRGQWWDIGTPERLQQLDNCLRSAD